MCAPLFLPSRLRFCLPLVALSFACERPPRQNPPAPAAEESEGKPQPSQEEADTNAFPKEVAVEEEISEGPDPVQAVDEPKAPRPRFEALSETAYSKAVEPLFTWVEKHQGNAFVALVDLESDKWLVRHRDDEPVNVASNAKIPTAAAALTLLGPAYQFKTEVFGELDREGSCRRLVLRGGGDPSLETADLYRFVTVLKGRGLVAVETLVVDQSLFDEQYVPPAFEQQPKEWAPFRANISALSLNQNAVSLNVAPTEEGRPARIWYDPPGVVVEKGKVRSAKKGAGDRVQWTLDPKADPQRMTSTLGGSLGVEARRRRYARRLEDPRLAPGLAFSRLLGDAGIEVSTVELGHRKREPRLALWSSEPLAELVRALGKDSDNFFAEMLLVALSQIEDEAKKSKDKSSENPWSSTRGAAVLVDFLKTMGAYPQGTIVKNGSGLFDANRYTAGTLVSVLAHIEDNPRVYYDFVSHLAMGATDGTMKKRMNSDPLAERVRAKTGTLRDVDALSGYVGRPAGASPLAFSIIVQGVRASHAEVRRRVDRAVLKWAHLSE